MGQEVRARARPEQSEQGQTRGDHDPSLARHRTPALGHDLCGRQDSDGAEQGGRRSHRVVVSAVDDGGEGVAADSGEQNEPEADTRAELITHAAQEHGARDGVAEHVWCIGVQRERGDRSPPLSGDDALGVSAAALEP